MLFGQMKLPLRLENILEQFRYHVVLDKSGIYAIYSHHSRVEGLLWVFGVLLWVVK